MTTDEKLQHFLDFCMEDSRARSAKMLDDCSPPWTRIWKTTKRTPKGETTCRSRWRRINQAGHQQAAGCGAAEDPPGPEQKAGGAQGHALRGAEKQAGELHGDLRLPGRCWSGRSAMRRRWPARRPSWSTWTRWTRTSCSGSPPHGQRRRHPPQPVFFRRRHAGGDPLQEHFDRQLLRLPHPGGEAPRIIPSDRKRRTGP